MLNSTHLFFDRLRSLGRKAATRAVPAGMLFFLSLPIQAQEAGVAGQAGAEGGAALAGATMWSEAGCFACHGDLAEGGGDAANALGPNLRSTQLEREGLIEVISCGRPGTPMPMHLEGAYTEVPCYDMPLGPVPDNVTGTGVFTVEEVGSLVDFLEEHVVGVDRITRPNCAAFFGGDENARTCLQY
jgi:hypothetical protein